MGIANSLCSEMSALMIELVVIELASYASLFDYACSFLVNFRPAGISRHSNEMYHASVSAIAYDYVVAGIAELV